MYDFYFYDIIIHDDNDCATYLTSLFLLLLLLPPLLLLSLAIDLLDQHVDVLYNCLKNIREKQYMSEGRLALLSVYE